MYGNEYHRIEDEYHRMEDEYHRIDSSDYNYTVVSHPLTQAPIRTRSHCDPN